MIRPVAEATATASGQSHLGSYVTALECFKAPEPLTTMLWHRATAWHGARARRTARLNLPSDIQAMTPMILVSTSF